MKEFFTGQMPFMSPSQWRQVTQNNSHQILGGAKNTFLSRNFVGEFGKWSCVSKS